ncbi:unnamed protein product [Anisakis simplex]|uniref:MTOR-associated protein MEAK7 n=1 Tax=Anisakis simplex TaxID=6269 RepID=A0A0M3JUG0_ANISI|nr:unnamed protein product [Anisakis simplex]
MGNSNGKNDATNNEKTSLDQETCVWIKQQFKKIAPNTDLHSFLLTCQSFIRFAEMVLGDYDQQAEIILKFGEPLEKIIEGIVSSFLKCEGCVDDSQSQSLLVEYILKGTPEQQQPSTVDTISKRLSHSTVFPTLCKYVFETLLFGYTNKLLPSIKERTLLTSAALLLITLQLPHQSRNQWKLLFSSRIHGESFSKLLKAVDGTGACVVIVETTQGRVFGGFANEGFVCGPQYSGDQRCFLFEDRHSVNIFNATGFNEHFAYLNHMQQTLPNGLGIGGADENWSLFLREEFGKGISSANISTFEKCWLAGENEFDVHNVEIWRIGMAKKRRRYDSEGNEIIEQKEISALDRDPEAVAVMEMSGKHMHSDGLREPQQIDDE